MTVEALCPKSPFQQTHHFAGTDAQITGKRAVSGIYGRPLKMLALSYTMYLTNMIIFM